ncbi:hypothetical protein [Microseira sp. BLCC-F43]|uniref:hypothetical protein n=1 Tax=Microseira sp. BLCC-F43 TaxID=3153602 RepID=UPI0035B92335
MVCKIRLKLSGLTGEDGETGRRGDAATGRVMVTHSPRQELEEDAVTRKVTRGHPMVGARGFQQGRIFFFWRV